MRSFGSAMYFRVDGGFTRDLKPPITKPVHSLAGNEADEKPWPLPSRWRPLFMRLMRCKDLQWANRHCLISGAALSAVWIVSAVKRWARREVVCADISARSLATGQMLGADNAGETHSMILSMTESRKSGIYQF